MRMFRLSTTVNPQENVLNGITLAIPAIALAILMTLALDAAGVIASISALVFCFAALWLYEKGAGGLPIKGRWFFLVLIIIGLALSFFAMVAIHLGKAYDAVALERTVSVSKTEFIRLNILNTRVLKIEEKNLFFFALFGLVGTFRVLKYIFATHKVASSAANQPNKLN